MASCIDNVPIRPIAEHRLFYGSHEECESSDDEVVEVPFESLDLNWSGPPNPESVGLSIHPDFL